MNQKHFVPILKWKKGEQIALENLTYSQKESIVPLIELTDVFDAKTFVEHLNKCFNKKTYVDTILANEDEDYLLEIIKYSNLKGYETIPVLYPSNDIEYYLKDTNYIAYKIGLPENIEGPTLKSSILTLIQLKEKYTDIKIDLIIDLGLVLNSSNASNQLRDLKNFIGTFVLTNNIFNTIIITATSFPEDISNIESGSKNNYKRYDILIFKKILEEYPELSKQLMYSDYGVTKFTETEIDFTKMKYGILPKIKYTCDEEYILWKGKRNALTKELEITYYTMSEELLMSKFYYGQDFSFGDKDIKERYEKATATKTYKCGNGTTWVAISANHHIAVLIEQLSKLF